MNSYRLAKHAVCLIAAMTGVVGVLSRSQGTAVAQGRGGQGGNPSAPVERKLLYVASPGAAQTESAPGILVFDVNRNFKFVKRIPTWDFPAGTDPCCEFGVAFFGEEIRGIAANAATGMLYLSSGRRLAGFSLTTEKKIWEYNEPNGECCDRMSLSPDGKTLYAPSMKGPRTHWYVLDATTGKVITTVRGPDGAHNTIYSPDGSRVYMEGISSNEIFIADPKTHTIVKRVGPLTDHARPFTVNGRGTLLYITEDSLFGFEIADVNTGKMLRRVEVAGFDPGQNPRANVSHGVALSADEKEVWLADDVNGYVHVFDNTVMPPKQVFDIKLRARTHGWITVGLDGKYIYPSSGDVIDQATKKIVAGLTDEFGKPVLSEKIVEIAFLNGKPVRTVDQFGIGQVRGIAPSQ